RGAEKTRQVKEQHLALLDALNVLLAQDRKPAVSVPQKAQSVFFSPATFSGSTWISQVHGIRAGPQRLS
ncbi:SecA regulator SecM, partial [Enterobacter cloacae]